MAKMVTNKTVTSVDILNSLRNELSADYRDKVPVAGTDAASIRAIGQILTFNPGLMNEFYEALVNRIGRVIITNKMWKSAISEWVDYGTLDYGDIVEDIFISLIDPSLYDPNESYANVEKIEKADVYATFYVINMKLKYKTTTSPELIQRAFTSAEGVNDLIERVIGQLFNSYEYDKFQIIKYLIAYNLINGRIKNTVVSALSASTSDAFVTSLKGLSNQFEFMTEGYNVINEPYFATKDDQWLVINAKSDAIVDVATLAAAFNMDKATFDGHKIMIDSFGNLNIARLDKIMAGNPNYHRFTADELRTLDETVYAVLMGRNYIKAIQALNRATARFNEDGLYTNNWLHVWESYSTSAYELATVFTSLTPSIDSVTLKIASSDASTGTISAGNVDQVLVTVDNDGTFASKAVKFTSSNTDALKVDYLGNVSVPETFTTADTSVTVTATSVEDSTKSASVTFTVNPS